MIEVGVRRFRRVLARGSGHGGSSRKATEQTHLPRGALPEVRLSAQKDAATRMRQLHALTSTSAQLADPGRPRLPMKHRDLPSRRADLEQLRQLLGEQLTLW